LARYFPDSLPQGQAKDVLLPLQSGPILPLPANCHLFPEFKGMYFWYLSPSGLNQITKFLDSPIFLPNEIPSLGEYKLVYLGTAGVRNTGANSLNRGHLRQRIEWHILTKHSSSTILNGVLSTLRTTLGCLISDDLEFFPGSTTEAEVTAFMAKYFLVTFIPYAGDIDVVSKEVCEDEKKLITTFRPLLNLKHNSNCKDKSHSTYLIKKRRLMVNSQTKIRLKQQ
jgi:hypothetical protein